MTLGRAWTRELVGASGAALLGPGAILAALVLLALGGGFGGLGSIGQVFSGPALAAAAGPHRGASVAPVGVPVAVSATFGRASAPPAGALHGPGDAPAVPGGQGRGAGNGGTPGTGTPGGSGTPGSGTPGSGTPKAPEAPGSPGGAGGGIPGTPGGPPPNPQPGPTAIDTAVNAATALTGSVPAPAGPLASGALRSLGATADGVLPPPLGSAAPASPRLGAPALP